MLHNTFGISAKCRRFVELESVEEAQEVLPTLAHEPLLVIGAGSNLLLTSDFDGVVLRSAIKGIETMDDGTFLNCGSGEKWDDVVAFAIDNGLYGMENLSHIPGDVGASAVQNIGAYGAEVSQLISSIEAVEIKTGKLWNISPTDCHYGYRTSRFKGEWNGRFLITHVVYQLSREFDPLVEYGGLTRLLATNTPTAEELRKVVIDLRREKLPDTNVWGNAGSFFVNPIVEREQAQTLREQYEDMPQYDTEDGKVKLSAGWLIEQCGWKGRALGRAGVYSRQALVLVNRGGATGEEVLALCESIRRDVKEKFGVELTPEVNIV